jgi:hypothetical protein
MKSRFESIGTNIRPDALEQSEPYEMQGGFAVKKIRAVLRSTHQGCSIGVGLREVS